MASPYHVNDADADDADDDDDAAPLSVFVGTWNVGNVAPRMDACVEWLSAARGHHVIAVAAQEARRRGPHARPFRFFFFFSLPSITCFVHAFLLLDSSPLTHTVSSPLSLTMGRS